MDKRHDAATASNDDDDVQKTGRLTSDRKLRLKKGKFLDLINVNLNKWWKRVAGMLKSKAEVNVKRQTRW